ncbi:MAG TPA: hypothetical protein VGA84_11120 [Thermoanaerobaculia bacterium]
MDEHRWNNIARSRDEKKADEIARAGAKRVMVSIDVPLQQPTKKCASAGGSTRSSWPANWPRVSIRSMWMW